MKQVNEPYSCRVPLIESNTVHVRAVWRSRWRSYVSSPHTLYLIVGIGTDSRLCAGCRSFFSINAALDYWNGDFRRRPEFVGALHALAEAIRLGEVIVTDDKGHAFKVCLTDNGEFFIGEPA